MTDLTQDPHASQPVLTAGTPPAKAKAAMLMVHGRGASAPDILGLAHEFDVPGVAYYAPQAAGNVWYPYRFMEPIASNEPYLTSALAKVAAVLGQIAAAGFAPEKTVLLGFSQGACLASEYVARHAQRYGGLLVLSGGLIGPDGTPRDYAGTLAGTPVLLGCSDVDPHIPATRVQHSAAVLEKLGGAVTLRLYPNMGHSVNHDEVHYIRDLLTELTA